MIYKKGPPFRIRPVADVCKDLEEARRICGGCVETLFFPAGNTIAIKKRLTDWTTKYRKTQGC